MWFAMTAIAAGLIVICLFAAAVGYRTEGVLGAVGTGVLWFVASLFFIWGSVEAGHVGLVREFGAYKGVKEEGLVTHLPWQTIQQARIRNASHRLLMNGKNENGSAASKESQEVFVVATINYSLEKSCVEELYRNYGADYYETIIEPRAKQIFKAESVLYSAVDILPNREKIRRETQAELTKQLEPYCIRGLDFLLTNVGFGQAFTDAIEQKQVATQQAAAEENRVQISKNQADQVREKAKGDADATRIQARADAYANRLRSRNLTPQLVEWERIQKWQPDVIYAPSEAIFSLPR